MEDRQYPEYILPHSDFGDPDRCGPLFPVARGDPSDITRNECGLVLKSVPAIDLQRTLDQMELSLNLASGKCPHCGAANLFPGSSGMLAFTCRDCGQSLLVDDNRGD
jgi:hypothetical protein